MKRDELLKWLEENVDRYGFLQISHPLKASFNLKNKSLGKLAEDLGISFSDEWIEEKAKELLIKANILINTPEAHQQQMKIIQDFIRSLVEDMPAKKPSVSEEFIKKEATKLISRFSCECKLSYLQQVGIRCVLTEKGDLWDLLTRAGVEVVEK